jgi:ligand-binding sensor domain-containing protein
VGPTYIDIRINGTAFDKSGNLWVTNSRIKWIKSFETNGQWLCHGWNLSPNDNNFGTIAIDKMEQNGFQPIAMVGFNESTNTFLKTGSDTGNLPSANVRTVAIDTRNQLWIGNQRFAGFAQHRNFQTEDQMKANPIIILEDNLAQELLEQFITDIC